jgi:uncharacterized protein (DUF2267 family)
MYSMNSQEHWENVYAARAPDQVSWFRPHLEVSRSFIERASPRKTLDTFQTAVDVTKSRLGTLANRVKWIVADVTRAKLPANPYVVWHDRAAFHFCVVE